MFVQYDTLTLERCIDNLFTAYEHIPPHAPLVVEKNKLGIELTTWDQDRIRDLLITLLRDEFPPDFDRVQMIYLYPTCLHYPIVNQKEEAIAFVIQQGVLPHTDGIDSCYTYEEQGHSVEENSVTRTLHSHYGLLRRNLPGERLLLVLPKKIDKIHSKVVYEPSLTLNRSVDVRFIRNAEEIEHAFWKKVFMQLPEHQFNQIITLKRALRFMKANHGPTLRKSGELYYTHPIAVAMKAMDYSPDLAIWIGALLHDVVEDTYSSLEEVGAAFGAEVKKLVRLVSTMRFSGSTKYKLANKKAQARMLVECSHRGAQLIKLCDRWHNLTTISTITPEQKAKKVEETLTYFIPMAKQIGYLALADTLQKLCA